MAGQFSGISIHAQDRRFQCIALLSNNQLPGTFALGAFGWQIPNSGNIGRFFVRTRGGKVRRCLKVVQTGARAAVASLDQPVRDGGVQMGCVVIEIDGKRIASEPPCGRGDAVVAIKEGCLYLLTVLSQFELKWNLVIAVLDGAVPATS